MKKLLFLTALLGTMAFGASTTPAPVSSATSTVTNEAKAEAKKEVQKEVKDKMVKGKQMMMKHLSEEEQAKFKANREEIAKLRKEANPDWDKIQKLSDENALLGSKARVEMMKAHPEMTMKDVMKEPATK